MSEPRSVESLDAYRDRLKVREAEAYHRGLEVGYKLRSQKLIEIKEDSRKGGFWPWFCLGFVMGVWGVLLVYPHHG